MRKTLFFEWRRLLNMRSGQKHGVVFHILHVSDENGKPPKRAVELPDQTKCRKSPWTMSLSTWGTFLKDISQTEILLFWKRFWWLRDCARKAVTIFLLFLFLNPIPSSLLTFIIVCKSFLYHDPTIISSLMLSKKVTNSLRRYSVLGTTIHHHSRLFLGLFVVLIVVWWQKHLSMDLIGNLLPPSRHGFVQHCWKSMSKDTATVMWACSVGGKPHEFRSDYLHSRHFSRNRICF